MEELDSSFASDDGEDLFKTELKFEQGGVSQKFTINERRRREILIPGKLLITENCRGEYLEWKPEESSPRHEPNVQEASGMVFKSGKEEEGIHYHSDINGEFRRPIRIELIEVKSFLVTHANKKGDFRQVIFIMCDGSTKNPFIFERGSPDNLITALERSVLIKRGRQKNLYIVSPKKIENTGSTPHPHLQLNVEDLLPENLGNIWGFVKDAKNDPYTATCTVLAKLADLAINGGDQSQSLAITRSKTPSPVSGSSNHHHTNDLRDAVSPSRSLLEDATLDPDYTTNEEGYEVIFKPEKSGVTLGHRPKTYRGQPLSQEQWLNYMENDGRISNPEEIKRIVFLGGVDPEIRKYVWTFLVGVYDWNMTHEERNKELDLKVSSYNRMKMQWASITEDQEERFHAFRDFKSLVDKDVARTDRSLEFFKEENNIWTEILKNILMTYIMYNFNLGYVQGMSDILSPILMEVQDEILAFWIFTKFMDKIQTNFEMSQEAMQQQLKDLYVLTKLVDPRFSAYLDACDAANMYFAFRWVLILYKREFSSSDITTLWEVLWSGLPGPGFHLFVGLSILQKHRMTIMENKFGLSEILRHVNDLSLKIDLEETLILAEAIYMQVLDAEENLPNDIRRIIGLPEKPPTPVESQTPTNGHSRSGGGDNEVAHSSTNGNGYNNNNQNQSRVPPSTSYDQNIESLCDISQFM